MLSYAPPHRHCRHTVTRLLLLAIATLLLFAPARQMRAQMFDATTLRQPTPLGMSWLFKVGDDPAWAQASYDDSQWTVIDPSKSVKSYLSNARPPVVWYRLHVKVAPNQTRLGLEEWNLSSAFDIYVNGQKLLNAGRVAPFVPSTFSARLLAGIPDSSVETGSFVIAMRVHIAQNDWISAYPAFYPSNLLLGQEAALRGNLWLEVIGENALHWFYALSMLGLGVIALALFTAQRQQREYLLLALLSLAIVLNEPLRTFQLFQNLPAWIAYVSGIFTVANLVLQVLMYLAFLRMPVRRWIQIFLALAGIGILSNSAQTAHAVGNSFTFVLGVAPELSLIAAVIPFLLILQWRRGNREAGILLIPAVVSSLTIYAQLGGFLLSLIPAFSPAANRFLIAAFNWIVGPFNIYVGDIYGCVFAISLAVILVLRSTRIAAQQAHIETELAAAREVQQIILPEQIESVPGFSVEAAYEPAQQVGGDFFQVLPAAEGSLLLVIGDVAGKGLPAAMLVSVLVGAIRGVAEYTSEPAELLANLNQRLMGRVAGNLSTAMAARIFPDGSVALANAGHLPPYLDGKEVEVPGALPLGARAGTRYETVRFLLPRGSRLTFYSDGIVEAQNEAGELFGFDRSGSIAMHPVAKIIEAAKLHGQCDDMTVIAITRAAATEAKAWSGETAMGVATP